MGARQLQSGEINSRNETREAQAGSELRAGVRGLERGQPQVAAGCPRHRWPTARPGPSDPARDCVGPSPRRPCPSLQAGNGGGQAGLMGCQQMRRGAGVGGGAGVEGEGPALGGAGAVLREGPALGGRAPHEQADAFAGRGSAFAWHSHLSRVPRSQGVLGSPEKDGGADDHIGERALSKITTLWKHPLYCFENVLPTPESPRPREQSPPAPEVHWPSPVCGHVCSGRFV